MAALVSQATLASLAFAQDFEINRPNNSVAGPEKSNKARPNKPTAPSSSQGLGWGSSIDVARQARAAQDALNRGDYAAATTYAQQAAKSAPQNTQLWFLLGYAARLASRYQVSLDAYQEGLRREPNSTAGLSGLAQTYAKMGRTDEAVRLLLKVVETKPNDVQTLELAGELLLEPDPNRALELLRKADSLQPSARPELLIARAYQRLNQPEQAKQFLSRAVSRAPKDPEVLRAVASQYRENGQYDQAISTLEAVPSKTPDVLTDLAYTYEVAGQKQKAADLYSQLADRTKGNIGLDLSAAQSLLEVGQPDAAQKFLDRAKQLNGDHYRLHALLGQIASSENRLTDGVSEYQLALRDLPPSPPEGPLYPINLRLNLYELYQQSGDQNAAKQQLDLAATELQQANIPTSLRPEFLRTRAMVESGLGDFDASARDFQAALALTPGNVNTMVDYASLLRKTGQNKAAQDMYLKALQTDPQNRVALISLGDLARSQGDNKQAAEYFSRAAQAHPKDFAPRLALGDLHSSQRDFRVAEEDYEAAYKLMPSSAQIIAGGAATALEGHDLDLAKRWLDRASSAMNSNPAVMREWERYLTWKGQYQEAADYGFKVLEQLPNDTEGAVYLAYDLYYLGRYQEALDLATKYDSILHNNRDLALIAGYVHVRNNQLEEALADFTRAVERDPRMATGFADRGFVLNDLRQARKAVSDFQTALGLQPKYPEAHLGLAYAYLQLHRPAPALKELELAQQVLGKERPWHLARAEAFRQERNFAAAEPEYRIALEEKPDDVGTQLALADTLYRLRRYNDAINLLNASLKISPENPAAYAEMAQAYSRLGKRQEMIQNVEKAEQYGKGRGDILMATGEALLFMGEKDAAMQRLSHALDSPLADTVGVRMVIADIFVREGHWDDAQRQVGLAFAEARVDENVSVTPDDFVAAANVFLAMHQFDLARKYFETARQAGADEGVVSIGLANSYLAQGKTNSAEVELARLRHTGEYKDNYQYLMAEATLYRQRQDTVNALSMFAQAGALAPEGDLENVQKAQYEVAGQEGRQINQNVSLFSNASFAPVFEDINVYTLDAKLLHITNPSLLPPPRHSYQSLGAEYFRLHFNHVPTISGFVGESMTSGRLFFPSNGVVQNRNTFDTFFNAGVTPILHLGSNTITLNPGLQFTIRRDTTSPVFVSQNLFRQYLYLSTSSFFNWVAINGSAVHESGPFTDQNLHSRDAYASLEFTVGRPWGKTSVIAGYTVRDLLYRPQAREYFTTSTYVGVQRKFGDRLTAAVIGEYLRSWLVQFTNFSIAQAILPAARVDYRVRDHWSIQGSFLLSRGEGFHAYDNAQGQFLISYLRPTQRRFAVGGEETKVSYPARFSFGIQEQTFYDFAGQTRNTILPIVRFTFF